MNRTLIIAEAGVNHNGSIEIAKRLVDAAKEAGVDIVKFQTFDVDSITSQTAQMANYQKKNLGEEKTQKEMLSELALSREEFRELACYCKQKEIRFLSTPFDLHSIEFLKELDCGIWKIPSGEITNYPYLLAIANTHQEIILSTGMCTMDEVDAAVTLLKENGAGRITLLHCTTQYPTPYADVNLMAMCTLRDKTGLEVGYSDHTRGIEVPIAAVAMGATVIEKHFTLDRNMHGPDHKASLEPEELKKMVEAIRHIELAMGDGEKVPTEAEKENSVVARKSIVAAKDIKKGEILSEHNLTTKRPGSGINPMMWPQVMGTKAVKDFEKDELIEL